MFVFSGDFNARLAALRPSATTMTLACYYRKNPCTTLVHRSIYTKRARAQYIIPLKHTYGGSILFTIYTYPYLWVEMVQTYTRSLHAYTRIPITILFVRIHKISVCVYPHTHTRTHAHIISTLNLREPLFPPPPSIHTTADGPWEPNGTAGTHDHSLFLLGVESGLGVMGGSPRDYHYFFSSLMSFLSAETDLSGGDFVIFVYRLSPRRVNGDRPRAACVREHVIARTPTVSFSRTPSRAPSQTTTPRRYCFRRFNGSPAVNGSGVIRRGVGRGDPIC